MERTPGLPGHARILAAGGFTKMWDCLRDISQHCQGDAQIQLRTAETGLQAHCGFEFRQSQIGFAFSGEQTAQKFVRFGEVRVGADSSLRLRLGSLKAIELDQRQCVLIEVWRIPWL